MITVLPVTDRRLTDLYIDLPFRLYRHDPLWVPPLRADMRKLMSPKKNPLFAEAAIEHFVALDSAGVAVGRISATIHHDYNRRFGEQHVFFGYFESENRQDVADALLAAVRAWALQRGKTSLIGPYSYTSTQDAALLLENCDGKPPTLLQTYNPPYYRTLLERAGFALDFTFSTFGMDSRPSERTERLRKLGQKLRERHRITVRSATKQDLKQNLEEVRQLFNSSFAGNYEVAPISAPVFGFQIDAVRPFVDLDGIRIIEVAGKPTAFFLILPDLNELLAKLKGSFGLLDLIRLPAYKRGIKKCVIALIGVDPELHGKGLGRVIAEEIIGYAAERFDETHTMWIDDRNPSSYVLAQNGGMRRTKRYGVFRKELTARPQAAAPAAVRFAAAANPMEVI
ncbi:N-acetyltransferase [Chitinimonas koreensis]|uniref:N-acetyltransferase n=1 Tax=Chitinimonas koreensis TaxID=356302 RepID=UPI0003F618FC|nr:N-acetyltransferase [Chitinimonas koreensis]QNM98213.1 N-acetyltransferase [Chitinimonas koreensis]